MQSTFLQVMVSLYSADLLSVTIHLVCDSHFLSSASGQQHLWYGDLRCVRTLLERGCAPLASAKEQDGWLTAVPPAEPLEEEGREETGPEHAVLLQLVVFDPGR